MFFSFFHFCFILKLPPLLYRKRETKEGSNRQWNGRELGKTKRIALKRITDLSYEDWKLKYKEIKGQRNTFEQNEKVESLWRSNEIHVVPLLLNP